MFAMKRLLLPTLVLGVLYFCFFGCLWSSETRLPARVATHFNASGQPNGWMSRDSHILFMAVFGLAFPLFVPAICYSSRFFPDRLFNLPHRDYWLAPGRRQQTMTYLFRQSLWFACLALAFVIGICFSTLQANIPAAAHLSALSVAGVAGPLLLGTAVWAVSLIRHFNHVSRTA